MSGGQRKRIAALAATPSKENVGMRFVNDALVRWLEAAGASADTDFFEFETPDTELLAKERVSWGSVLDLAPDDYDTIIVWGDFLIDRNWIRRACQRVADERSVSAAEVETHVRRVVFGREQAPARPKRIVVGQCFLVSDDGYESDRAYRESFIRLARGARLFATRDPISAARALAYSGVPAAGGAGLDCALLRPALCEPAGAPAAPQREGYGLFFGRTEGGLAAKVAAALAARAARFAGRPYYVPWFPKRELPPWIARGVRPEEMLLPDAIDDIVARLRRFHFVLTDTYHLSLVCWSIGVPAVCLGRGAQRFGHPVDDKKKEIFFLSHRIERFHLYAERGFRATLAQARGALREIGEVNPGPEVARQIGAQARELLDALGGALRD